jgi:hypothetical protein
LTPLSPTLLKKGGALLSSKDPAAQRKYSKVNRLFDPSIEKNAELVRRGQGKQTNFMAANRTRIKKMSVAGQERKCNWC